jgi:hypothetical protein
VSDWTIIALAAIALLAVGEVCSAVVKVAQARAGFPPSPDTPPQEWTPCD